MLRTVSLMSAAAMALAGCMADTPQTATARAQTALVSVPQAVAHFDAICGATKPGFAAAPARMAARGFTRKGADGFTFHASQQVGMKIETGKSGRKACIMRATVAGPAVPEDALKAQLGTMRATASPGIFAFDGRGRGKVIYGPPYFDRKRPKEKYTFELGYFPGL